MNRKVHAISLLLAATIPFSAPVRSQEQNSHISSIIKQVDHILILSYEADGLYSLLTNILRLPVVKPYQTNSKGFTNGIVCAGNVNLEVISIRSEEPSTGPNARFGNIAFEPINLTTSLRALEARGISYTGPFPYVETDSEGQQRTRWTNVGLATLRGGFSPFLCEYSFDVGARRKVCQTELQKREGGPIGLQHAGGIVIGVKDLDDAILRWRNVLDPIKSTARGLWRIGNGPSIQLVQSDRDHIQRLVLSVRSLKSARIFLERNKMLGMYSKGEMRIDAETIQGLNISLVEK